MLANSVPLLPLYIHLMKTALLILCILTGSAAVSTAQIVNSGFESAADTAITLPQGWGVLPKKGYHFFLDSAVKHEGHASFHLQSVGDSSASGFAPFSQAVPTKPDRLQKLTVSAFIKTRGLKGDAGLWCQVRDKDDYQIGFANLQEQDVTFGGDADWKKYSLNLVCDTTCRRLVVGGYISGTGDIWYDDFSVEHTTVVAGSHPPTKEVRRFISRFTTIVRKNSIYSDKLDWPTIEQDVAGLSEGMASVDEARLVTGYVLSKLQAKGDNHSFIMNRSRSEQAGKKNVDGRQPSGRMLEGGVGYLYVPGFFSVNDTAKLHFAQKLHALIRQLDSSTAIKGWIVDLRENTGGNMYPMIAGLGPLIGDGTAGYFVDAKGRRTKWFYKSGVSGAGSGKEVKVGGAYSPKAAAAKVAVLIGPRTSSSGEMTTISFIGKPNVRLFGGPSGGYTTANKMFSLSNGATLLLASSYCSDRTGKSYTSKIQPDVTVAERADAVRVAQDWLAQP